MSDERITFGKVHYDNHKNIWNNVNDITGVDPSQYFVSLFWLILLLFSIIDYGFGQNVEASRV